jgi:hypothetical protein
MIGLVRVGALAEQDTDDLRPVLLDRDDQRRFAHPVRRVDLGAEAEQPFHRLLEAYARGDDQRRVSVLSGKVGVSALVEQKTGPLLVAPIKSDDQSGVSLTVLGIDEALRMAVEKLGRLVAVPALHRLGKLVPVVRQRLGGCRRRGEHRR